MRWDRYRLPDEPPNLQESVTLPEAARDEMCRLLTGLSGALDNLPAVLSQRGEVVCASDTTGSQAAVRVARVADRIWQGGTTCLAREVIRFGEETIEESAERLNVMLYSAHVDGALTISVGWQLSISLTQLRAEVADTRRELLRLLET